MDLLKKILVLLNKPFPREENNREIFKTIVYISIFITLFLYIFRPFGFNEVKSNAFLLCLGFGGITFMVSIIYEIITNTIFKLKSESTLFTFWKWIFLTMGLISFISLANFLFMRLYFFGNIQWEFFPYMIRGTFAIGILPVIMLGAISLLRLEKRHQSMADEINQNKTQHSKPKPKNEQYVFNIPIRNIRYIEALQNYIKIGHVNDKAVFVEQTERATLKMILDDTENSSIVKCHRSYLVNRDAIVATSGNAQGFLLSLEDCEKTVPVSRSFVSIFKQN